MKVIECKYDINNYLVWKSPYNSIQYGSQVIVNQSQQALLFNSGELVKILEPGPHTLETVNIPILEKLRLTKSEEFPIEIWFINKVSSTNFKWGTSNPIQIKDKQHGLLLEVTAYGNYEILVSDVQKLLLRIVGVKDSLTLDQLREFLFPFIERETKNCIAEFAINKDIFNISSELNNISKFIKESLEIKLNEYGLKIRDFFTQNINIKSDDPSFEKVKSAISESASIKIKGDAISSTEEGYKLERSFDVLKSLAENEGGTAGAFAGAGLGLGAGINLGKNIDDISSRTISNSQEKEMNDPYEKIKKLKQLLDIEAITQEEFNEKKAKLLEEL